MKIGTVVFTSSLCFTRSVPPSIRGSDEVSPLTVTVGGLVTLLCESSGIPPPSLTWKKNGKIIIVLFIVVVIIEVLIFFYKRFFFNTCARRLGAEGRLACARVVRRTSAADHQCREERCCVLHLPGVQRHRHSCQGVQPASLRYSNPHFTNPHCTALHKLVWIYLFIGLFVFALHIHSHAHTCSRCCKGAKGCQNIRTR